MRFVQGSINIREYVKRMWGLLMTQLSCDKYYCINVWVALNLKVVVVIVLSSFFHRTYA